MFWDSPIHQCMGAFIIYVHKQGEGVSPKCQQYNINLCSELVNEGGGGTKNLQNPVNAVYGCPLFSMTLKRMAFWKPSYVSVLLKVTVKVFKAIIVNVKYAWLTSRNEARHRFKFHKFNFMKANLSKSNAWKVST